MNTARFSRSQRLAALLLLCAHGAAWAQDAAPAAPPADAPTQPAAVTAPAPAPAPVPQYVPRPMSARERELQRRLSLRHYALMGAATILTGAGFIFGAKSKSSLDEASTARNQVAARDALKHSREQALVANGAFIGAGTAVVAAVVTYFISPPTPPPEDKATATTVSAGGTW